MRVVLHEAWNESQWTILLGYLEQMTAATEQVMDDNSVFQQGSTPAHCACNAVQLLQREILNFLFPQLRTEQPRAELQDYKI